MIALALMLLPAPVFLPEVVIQPSSIVQVLCFTKKDLYSGTAFRVGPDGEMLSVNHVTSAGECYIGKDKINGHVWASPKMDFSVVSGEPGSYLTIDCGGFVKDRKYMALGFARGESPVTKVELKATGKFDKHGEAILEGMWVVIPGMSGGPVIDEETGRVVGTVNEEDFEDGYSWSVALKDTPVCRKAS